MFRPLAWCISMILCGVARIVSADPAAVPPQNELEKQFGKTMSNATLAGSFTTGEGKAPKADKYSIGAVTKKEGANDIWIFQATIQYGGHNISIPLEIPVKWAGDTAVITVDNVGIPGLGQYTARVMIFGQDYVGVWGASDGSHGGKMWGKVVHNDKEP